MTKEIIIYDLDANAKCPKCRSRDCDDYMTSVEHDDYNEFFKVCRDCGKEWRIIEISKKITCKQHILSDIEITESILTGKKFITCLTKDHHHDLKEIFV